MSATIFVGWDPREVEAYRVCEHSLKRSASGPVDVRPIVLDDLRRQGLYRRPTERRGGQLWDVISEAPMSTEFAISRFFLPLLAARAGLGEGWAVFCDCDFLWLGDVYELLGEAKPGKALYCVQHRYEPTETVKMDGQAQLRYLRKNWSSLMLFDLAHPAHRKLTLDLLNDVPGRDLHRFCWLADEEIGALSPDWNWLEGASPPTTDRLPRAIHFTRGGPWMEGWRHVQHADLWLAAWRQLDLEQVHDSP